ncbi:hypothetical protein DEI99_015395 [Curtobacterium sp. MCLR17_036]|uniref:hypothetical protein n=1 Tax=Curtobacterium sp. MCLR17_036 TaxID=2175620 RepID=UPI0011B6EC5C|nr:hypothetical protein [Curtobacterium sp. MCLR17_036]WIE64595.1 hypothetical protein DEI99_015395 [Curtobacterium sp. MCLR17_036]
MPVPNDLYLAIESDGRRATEPHDRGLRVEFAYSVADDRPATRGVTTRQVTRQSLLEDERGGRFIVQVDVAEGHGDGVPITEQQPRRPGLVPLAPSGVRALELSAADGIWGDIVSKLARPHSAWRLFEASAGGSSCSVVIDTDPDGWRTRAVEALGRRPHPEIAVVDSPDAVARRWRRAARHLLGPTPG